MRARRHCGSGVNQLLEKQAGKLGGQPSTTNMTSKTNITARREDINSGNSMFSIHKEQVKECTLRNRYQTARLRARTHVCDGGQRTVLSFTRLMDKIRDNTWRHCCDVGASKCRSGSICEFIKW